VLLHDRHGETLEVACKEVAMTQLLQELKGRVPWTLFGHSPELEGL
jgi:hypothetical protein